MTEKYPAALTAPSAFAPVELWDIGIDFHVFPTFDPAPEADEYMRAWKDDPEATADDFRFFGKSFDGGYAALWLTREGHPLEDQPVVFLDSEGEVAVVAPNLSDFPWLLANGVGPCEAVREMRDEPTTLPALATLAEQHATTPRRDDFTIVSAARTEFPGFTV